jgi:hypothetical protein
MGNDAAAGFTGRLSAESTWDGPWLRVALRGTGLLPEAQALEEFLRRVHRTAVEASAPVVVIDLREAFLSSSCQRTILVWLRHVQPPGQAAAYHVVAFCAGPETGEAKFLRSIPLPEGLLQIVPR